MSRAGSEVEGYPSTLVRGESIDARLLDVQRENADLHFAAMNAVQHDTKRRILWALVQRDDNVPYRDLDDILPVSDRTARKHVTNLVEDDLVDRVESKRLFLTFASLEAEVLIRESIARWYDTV